MYKFLLLAGIPLVLAGCASKEKEPPYLTVDPPAQIVADVYIRYAGAAHETKSLGGAAYRQSEIIFSLNEAEDLNVPVPERKAATAAIAVPKPAKVKHVSNPHPKAKPAKSKPASKPHRVKPKAVCPVPADPCPPVQVIIKETTYCKECPNLPNQENQ